MPRPSAVRSVVALALFATACTSPQRARLDAHGVGLAGEARERGAFPVDASAAAAGAAVDHVLEASLRRELEERRAAGGDAAIEVLEPGATIESRLRFVLGRLLLGRRDEAAAALTALTTDAPGCALAWFLLGQIRAEQGDARTAVDLMRRARSLAREQRRPEHPSLNFALGRTLLATDESDEGLRLLREELASGTHRVRAAEVIAFVQADQGDFEAATAALDAVLDDVPDEPTLVIAKAELLADQLRADEALALLGRRGQRVPPVRLATCRASILRQRGDAAGAAAVLAELLEKHGGEPAVEVARARIEELQAEIDAERARGRQRARPRELLGRLRFAPQPGERAYAVRLLCSPGAPAAVVPAAVRWALRDPHPSVRVAAIQAGLPRCENPADLLTAGLADDLADVRAAAAAAAAEHPTRAMFGPLVAALTRESDPGAFRVMHRALVRISGKDLDLPFDGERSEEVRTRLSRAWSEELARAGKETGGT